MILIAAAPGEILPQFPAPTHVFTNKGGLASRNMTVDNEKVCSYIFIFFIFMFYIYVYKCKTVYSLCYVNSVVS